MENTNVSGRIHWTIARLPHPCVPSSPSRSNLRVLPRCSKAIAALRMRARKPTLAVLRALPSPPTNAADRYATRKSKPDELLVASAGGAEEVMGHTPRQRNGVPLQENTPFALHPAMTAKLSGLSRRRA